MTTDTQHGQEYHWAHLWCILADEGELHEGDVVPVSTKDGRTQLVTIAAVVPFTAKSGRRMVRAIPAPDTSVTK